MSSLVIVLLRPEWESCNVAMEYMEMIGKDPSLHVDPSKKRCTRSHGLDVSSVILRRYIRQGFTLPWNDRVRTVQEYVLSKRALIQCGSHTINGTLVESCLVHLLDHARRCCPGHLLAAQSRDTYNFEMLRKISNQHNFDIVLSCFRIRK
jgi:hypothetical protein